MPCCQVTTELHHKMISDKLGERKKRKWLNSQCNREWKNIKSENNVRFTRCVFIDGYVVFAVKTNRIYLTHRKDVELDTRANASLSTSFVRFIWPIYRDKNDRNCICHTTADTHALAPHLMVSASLYLTLTDHSLSHAYAQSHIHKNTRPSFVTVLTLRVFYCQTMRASLMFVA